MRKFLYGYPPVKDLPVTTHDLRCDICGRSVLPAQASADPSAAGVRFSYHPGAAALRDDSGLLCGDCWAALAADLGEPVAGRCARCGDPVAWRRSLHLRRYDEPSGWQLCEPHAAEVLNRLRTVEPKLDPASFRLPVVPEAGSGPAQGAAGSDEAPSPGDVSGEISG